ncbi:hypothetical protein FTRO_0011230 [Fructobacillus tropaeoli]|uniref:Uncharacterized protein n=1 Tax=Fructobacillus tropaeoli TaxID=709323 RepID=A0A3F3H7E1_9LACO|nr:hypothetical protein FTRO_0011230 [Fructobacillus tropaeoli]
MLKLNTLGGEDMKIKISKISFIVVLFMAFLTLVIGLFFHIKGYWNNYWTFWSSFSGAITAVIVFIW